jgi:phage tail-like protein
MPQTGQRIDPFRNFNFLVEIDGIAQASFTDCSGLSSTTQIIETREGGDNTTVRKMPGLTQYENLTLKSGMTSSVELWTWRQQIIDGIVIRRNGSVVVYDPTRHAEVARWNFFNAWPSKWEGATFTAKGNDIAIDTLVLAHEGLARV